MWLSEFLSLARMLEVDLLVLLLTQLWWLRVETQGLDVRTVYFATCLWKEGSIVRTNDTLAGERGPDTRCHSTSGLVALTRQPGLPSDLSQLHQR